MALNREVWIKDVQENFYPDNSFAAKSVDDSAYVKDHTVHIPNAGAASKVVVNRSQKPASVTSRNDNELTYDIDELTTDPIYIPNIDTVELSYDKRQSVIANDRQQLQTEAAQTLLYRWAGALKTVVTTTGTAKEAHTSDTATGYRKGIVKADIQKLNVRFNIDNVPQEGRYILLDAVMYAQLLDDLTDKELSAFLNSANAQKGILGQLYGFSIMMRSSVLRTKIQSNKPVVLPWSENAVATECAAGLAWQENCVSRALGEIKMFDRTDDPTYYGDIYSFLLRTGGSPRRYDKKGIALIVQDQAADPNT